MTRLSYARDELGHERRGLILATDGITGRPVGVAAKVSGHQDMWVVHFAGSDVYETGVCEASARAMLLARGQNGQQS